MCDPFFLMWAGFLDICYAFKGKYSKISVRAILKGYCFIVPHGNRQGTSKCPPCSSKTWASHRSTGKAVCELASSHCNRTPGQGVHSSLFLTDGNMASPSGDEAMATHLSHPTLAFWAMHIGTQWAAWGWEWQCVHTWFKSSANRTFFKATITTDSSGGWDGGRREGISGAGDGWWCNWRRWWCPQWWSSWQHQQCKWGKSQWCWVMRVVMAALGGYKHLPAQALCRSHSSSLQKQQLRESACGTLPTHSMPSGANNWLLMDLASHWASMVCRRGGYMPFFKRQVSIGEPGTTYLLFYGFQFRTKEHGSDLKL